MSVQDEVNRVNRMLKIIVLVVVFGVVVYALNAEASIQCGIKPIPPIGCEVVYCQCDDSGCRWVFRCD